MYQGDYLTKYLEEHRISKSELAKRMGVTRQTVFQYCASKNLERETVKKILTALGVKETDVFTDLPVADVIIQTPTEALLIELKKTSPPTQGEHLKKFVEREGLTDTEIARAIGRPVEQISHFYKLRKFGENLIQIITKAFPKFDPIDETDIGTSYSQPEYLKDLIIGNLLEQIQELKDKLAHYETGSKRKHA